MSKMYSAQEATEDSIENPIEEEINIVLVGQSGVGKSTFINSCLNYFVYESWKEAVEKGVLHVIPAKVSIMEKNFERISVQIGTTSHKNERLLDGEPSTMHVTTYLFPVFIRNKLYNIRFIDTPGIGDKRGYNQDTENCQHILSYLSQLKEIHAFCILLTPIETRLSIFMNYCINQILSRLEKSARENVVFVFTNTRGQDYTPGDTYTSLKVLLKEIHTKNGITIPLCRNNMFCYDNESFKTLAALSHGIPIADKKIRTSAESFKESSDELWRMIYYITSLDPHDLKKTVSVNDAHTMAAQMSKPMTEIVQVIGGNIRALKQHNNELSNAQLKKTDLELIMYTPQEEIEIAELKTPQTVCTDPKCTTSYMVGGIRRYEYKQKCCPNCYCFFVPSSVIGNPLLYLCSAFDWDGNCKTCEHSMDQHIHIYYETTINVKKMDETMLPKLTSLEDVIKEKERLVRKHNDIQQELNEERTFILQSSVVFDQFLKENSVTSIGEPIKDYLKYQIHREESLGGSDDDTVIFLKHILDDYEIEKLHLKSGKTLRPADYSPDAIQKRKESLFTLKNFGHILKKLYDLQQSGSAKQQKISDIVIGNIFKKTFTAARNYFFER